MDKVLEGIRVLDFTDSISGPFVTLLLALCGAEVIKIESRMRLGFRKVGPWGPRGNGPIPLAPEKTIDFSKVNMDLLVSPVFSALNFNKKSISLNLEKPGGRDLFGELVKKSDIVIDNLRFGIMEKWGLNYEHLKELKEDIIVVSLPSLGKGPYENWATWAMNLMSFTGFAFHWGHPDTPMTERVSGHYYADYISGLEAVSAVMAALYYRMMSGKGQYVEICQAEAATSVLGPIYLDHFVNHRISQPAGNRHPQFAPYNCYRCRGDDEWCFIAVRTEEEWCQFCEALENTPWTHDPKFKDMESRVKNWEELDRNIERWIGQYTPHQAMRYLQYFGVAAGAVQTSEDVYFDAQLRDRRHIIEQELPRLGKLNYSPIPFHFLDNYGERKYRTPVLGEHNGYVFGDLLGLSGEKIKDMEDSRIIY